MVFIGVVDALPNLLELEAVAAGNPSAGGAGKRSTVDTCSARASATMLLLRLCGAGSQEGVDALLRVVRTHLVTIRFVIFNQWMREKGLHATFTATLMVIGLCTIADWNGYCAD